MNILIGQGGFVNNYSEQMMLNQGIINNGSSLNDMNSFGLNQSMSPMAF